MSSSSALGVQGLVPRTIWPSVPEAAASQDQLLHQGSAEDTSSHRHQSFA